VRKSLIIFLFASTIVLAQKVNISDAWIRPAGAETNTGVFFIVTNDSDKPDTLFNAKSNLAEVVEVHETFKRENDMMGMRKVSFVVIPPNSTVRFKPRDLHVMLIKLKKDVALGTHGKLTLQFRNSGDIQINAIVRDMPKMK
jgi:copper(I)-binding protein